MQYVVTVRGRLKHKDQKETQAAHDAVFDKLNPIGRPLGSTGHRAYLNVQSGEFLATDYWDSLEGMQKFMSDPKTGAEIGQLFEEPPEVNVWAFAGWKGY